jgi:hypothetical protein
VTSRRPYYHEFAWAYDLLQTDAVAPQIDFIEQILNQQGIGVGSVVFEQAVGQAGMRWNWPGVVIAFMAWIGHWNSSRLPEIGHCTIRFTHNSW